MFPDPASAFPFRSVPASGSGSASASGSGSASASVAGSASTSGSAAVPTSTSASASAPIHPRPAAICLAGYYGCGNCGDEAILAGTLAHLRRAFPGATVTVLSGHPRQTALRHRVRAIWRYDPAILTTLARSEIFLLGGGSLLTDRTSMRSLCYYAGLFFAARAMGCRVAIDAAGLGPLRRPAARGLVAKMLAAADSIGLRDDASVALAKKLCPTCNPLRSADAALYPEPRGTSRAFSRTPDPIWQGYLLQSLGVKPGAYFAVALRPMPEDRRRIGGCNPARELRMAAHLVRIARREHKTPLLLTLHDKQDRPLAVRVAKLVTRLSSFNAPDGTPTGTPTGEPVGSPFILPRILPALSPTDTQTVLAAAQPVIAMRLHAAILAIRAGVPPENIRMISYDPKTRAFLQELRNR